MLHCSAEPQFALCSALPCPAMSNIHKSLRCPIMLCLVMLCPAACCCGPLLTLMLA